MTLLNTPLNAVHYGNVCSTFLGGGEIGEGWPTVLFGFKISPFNTIRLSRGINV